VDDLVMTVEQHLERFSEAEALDLAATVPVGRIVYRRYALPAVFIVRHRSALVRP
jgi:hypothetical protein